MTSSHAAIQKDVPITPEKLDLHDLVEQYRTQPDLLKLILASKVEQDKRKAEEAKLRAKELDVYLHQHNCANHRQYSHGHKRRLSSTTASSLSSASSEYSTQHSHEDSLDTYNDKHTRNDAIMNQRRNSAAAAMVALASDDSLSISYPSPDSSYDDDNNHTNNERPRKRREMQAITKIVETREFPYQDNYFWKNNGNTTQKKTGCKSIYYKCSNSNKGCAVNKTVTARPNGEYLIKYRGQHLLECGRVERVCEL